jgi:hypothetical protein
MPPTSEGLAGGENRQLLSLESILPHLQGVRRLANGGYMARCPVHDDTNPSLSLREENGKLLWKCFAGCSQEAVQRELERRVGIPRETDRPSGQEDYTPVKLDELADAFELTAEKLRAYGVRDIPAGYAPEAPKGGIEIPYLIPIACPKFINCPLAPAGSPRFARGTEKCAYSVPPDFRGNLKEGVINGCFL